MSRRLFGLLLSILLVGGCGGGSDSEFIDDTRILQGIRLAPSSVELPVGLTQAYQATGEYSDGTEENITASVSWVSTDPAVASVDAAGEALGIATGEILIQASQAGISGEAQLEVVEPIIVEATILPPAANIPLGSTQDYRAFAVYSNGSYENVTFEAEWSLKDESGIIQAYEPVLTRGLTALDDFGTVIAVDVGDDELLVSIEGQTSESVVVVVEPLLTSLSISPRDETLPAGTSLGYMATGTYEDGSTADLTKVVIWTSANDSVAVVSNEPGERGLVGALAPGETAIEAIFASFSDSTALTVINEGGDEIVRIDVLPPTATIGVGESISYSALGITANGDSFDITTSATWSTTDPGVAAIDTDGLARGVAGGSTTIAANFESVTGSAALAVEDVVLLESIAVAPVSPTLLSLTTAQFTATGHYSNGTSRDLTMDVTWQSEDESILVASNDPTFGHGLAFALAPGLTSITAQFSGISGITPVEVIASDEARLELVVSPAIADVPIGGSQQYRAELVNKGRSALDVTDIVSWRSLAPSIAEIDSNGRATGIDTGTATIAAQLALGELRLESAALLGVLPPPTVVTGIVVSPPSASIVVGDTQAFTAVAKLSNGQQYDVTAEVSWTTADAGIAVIDLGGIATGVGSGETTINARYANGGATFTDESTLTVAVPVVTDLVVIPTQADLLPGTSIQYAALVYFESGDSADVTGLVAWSSSDIAIAGITDSGLATAVSPGTVSIESVLLYQGQTFTASGQLTVNDPPVVIDQLVVSPATAEVLVEGTQAFTAKVLLSNGTEQDVTKSVSWAAADTGIATVNGEGVATGLTAGETNITADLTFEGEDYSDSSLLVVLPPLVTIEELVVDPSAASILIGSTFRFTARVNLSDGTYRDVSSDVAWLSDSEDIAHIDTTGLVTGLAEGQGTISANLIYQGESFTGSSLLTVKEPAITVSEVRVLPPVADVFRGGQQKFTAEAVLSNDDVIDVTMDVSWTVADTAIATVDASGLATGKAPGQTFVRATLLYEGAGYQGEATLTVNPPEVTVEELLVEPPSADVLVGSSVQFTARLIFSDRSQQTVTEIASWSSDDPEVASVEKGLATGLSPGNSVIAASLNIEGILYSDTADLTVETAAPEVTGIRVDPGSAEILVDTSRQFTAVALFSDESELGITDDVTWQVLDTDIAHISAGGLATGISEGSTEVKAIFTSGTSTYEDRSDLTIKPEPITVTALVVSPENAETLVRGTVSYRALAKLSDESEQDVTDSVTWISEQPATAQIDSSGLATGLSAGTATIKAQLAYGDDQTITGNAALIVTAVTVETLTISPDNTNLLVGEQAGYSASAQLSDNTELDVTGDVTWTVGDDTVAHIDISGLATGLSEGTSSIDAALVTSEGTVTDSATITVEKQPAALVRVDVFPPAVTLPLGTTQDFRAIAVYDDNTTTNVTFDGTWSLPNDPPILERYEPGAKSLGAVDDFGTAIAINVGTDTLTFDYEGLTSVSDTVVAAPVLESITVSPRTVITSVGTATQFKATGSYNNGTSVEITSSVTWASSDPIVAAISNSSPNRGLATALELGATVITASQSGVSDSTVFTVNDDPLTRVDVLPADATLPVDGQLQYTAQAVYASGRTEDVTNQASWAVPSDGTAAIDETGNLMALAEGMTSISATFSNLTGSTQLTVDGELTLLSVQLEPASATVFEFQTIQFDAYGFYNDESTRKITDEVTWSSDNTTVFAISNDIETFGKGLGIGLTPDQSTIVRAIMPGTALEGSASASVLPLGDEARKLEVTPVNAEILVDGSQQYKADLFLTDGSQIDVSNYVVWSSADEAVAVIDGNGLAFGESDGMVAIRANLPQLSDLMDEVTLVVKAPVTIDSIVVSPPSATVLEGETASYTAEALLSNGDSLDVTADASWSSADAAIASAMGGVATGVSEGTTSITATVQYQNQNYQGSASIEVLPVVVIEEIIVDPAVSEILAGGVQQYIATARLSDDRNITITQDANWKSSDNSVASVSVSGLASGITGGATTITASIVYEGVTYSGAASLNVRDITVERVVVSPKALDTLPGGTVQFTASAILTDASIVDITSQVTWFTTDVAIAVIESGDNAGRATGVGEGIVTVYVEVVVDDVEVPCLEDSRCVASLEVKPLQVTEIQVTPAIADLDVGATLSYTATAVLNNGDSVDATDNVTWQSSDVTIASVTPAGVAQGVSEGDITVTASIVDNGKTFSGDAALTVLPPPVTIDEIVVSPANVTILTGGSQGYTATAILSDQTSRDVTSIASWASGDKKVVVVSARGLATGVGAGVTSIEAGVNYEGISYSGDTLITVEDPVELVSVTITPRVSDVLVGEHQQFIATATLSNNDRVDVTSEAVWFTGNSAVAAVGLKATAGLVTGTGAGKTEVWADYTFDGVTFGCENNPECEASIKVSDPIVVERILVTPQTASRIVSTTIQYTAQAELSDSSLIDITADVTWTSSDNNVAAPQNAEGLFIAVSPGTSIVTATGVYDDFTFSDDATLSVESVPVVVDRIEVLPGSATTFTGEQQAFKATAHLSNGDEQDVTTDSTWQSSDTNVVAVDPATGVATAVSEGTGSVSASFTFEGNVSTGMASMTVIVPVLETIDVTPDEKMVVEEELVVYTATGNYSDGSSMPLAAPDWTSSDSQVATVSSDGVAEAISAGSSSITASQDGISGSATLTVSDRVIDDLQIYPFELDDAAGTLGRLSAVAHFNNNTTEVVTQLGAWSVADNNIVTVVDTAPLKGGYALKTPGDTTISVAYMGFTDTISVVVSDPALIAIVVTPLEASTPAGVVVQFEATGIYANLTSSDLTDDVVWSSSDEAVTSISATGSATGKSEGTTTVTASFNGVSGTATHNVTVAVVTDLTVSPPEWGGPAGTSKQLEALARYSDGTQEDVTSQATWESSDEAILNVDSEGTMGTPGLVALISAGSASASATFEGASATVPFEVTTPVVVDLFVDPWGETYPEGLLVEYVAIATYDNGTGVDVTGDAIWHSTDGDVIVANPDQPGQFQTVAAGMAAVTATFAEIVEDSPVTITPAQVIELQIEPPSPSGAAGTQELLTATAFYDNLTREDVTDQATWVSSSSDIANVVPTGEDQGLLQYIAEGTAEISATFEGVTQAVLATSTAAVLVDIIVQPANLTIANGLTQQYEAIGIYSDGSDSPLINSTGIRSAQLTDEVIWESGDLLVAQVDTNGLATTVGVGVTDIMARLGEVSGTTSLTVSDATVKNLEIQPISSTGPAGTDSSVVAIATLTDDSIYDASGLVVWGSRSGFIATVSFDSVEELAFLSYNNPGETVITATLGQGDDAVVAEATAITTAATLERIELTPNPLSFPEGSIRRLIATGFYSDGSVEFLGGVADFVSQDPSIATVTQAGLVEAVTAGTTKVTASLDNIVSNAEIAVTDAALVSLQVTPADITGPKGATKSLTATGLYTDGETEDLTSLVTWRSDDTLVATVTSGSQEAGVLQLVGQGATTIAAALEDLVDTIEVRVTEAELVVIRIQPSASIMPEGTSQQLNAIGLYTDTTVQNISNTVTWSSSFNEVVQLAPGGVATANGIGVAKILATQAGILDDAFIIVSSPELVNLQITPSTLVEPAGTSGQFTATGTYSNGLDRDLTNKVVWESSDSRIVTLTNLFKPGLASLIQPGNVTVTASLSGISDQIPVEVTAAELESIRVNPSTETVAEGTTVQYTATGVFTDGSTTAINQDVSWSSADTGIARIEPNGLADTIGVGATVINATTQGITGSANLEVTDAIPVLLEITPASSPPLLVGQTRQYRAQLTYSDGETAVVTSQVVWRVEPSGIATATSVPGLIQAVAQGVGEVVARFDFTAFSKSNAVLEARVPLEVGSFEIVSVEINTFRETGQPVEIPAGRSESWQAFANFNDGTFVEITDDALWNSSTQAVATALDGDIAALTPGASTISIQYIDLEGSFRVPGNNTITLTDEVGLTVTNAVLTDIVISPDNAVIAPGQTEYFTAIGNFSDGSSENITADANWSTGDVAIAVVDQVASTTTVRGLGLGATDVTVNKGGVFASASIEVTDQQVPTLLTVSEALPISVGSEWPFTAIVEYADGDTANVTNDASWSSSTPEVASVYNIPEGEKPRGTASTIAEGSTVIMATIGGLDDSTTLTATQACESSGSDGKPNALFILPAPAELPGIGDVLQLQAIGVFLDDCQTSLTVDPNTKWKVTGQGGSNKVIDIISTGLVTGLKCGIGKAEANYKGVKATIDVNVCE